MPIAEHASIDRQVDRRICAVAIDVVRRRLVGHGLVHRPSAAPAEVVRRMLAVQAQDYPGAAWAVGQRSRRVTAAAVDAALAEGEVVRTHVLRPTWHLVARDDIRWLLDLTAARVRAAFAYYSRQAGLDEAAFMASNRALERALSGGARLTRRELGDVLSGAGGGTPHPLAVGHLLMRAELDGVVCSGGLRGRQQTYAHFDERVPAAAPLDRDEALARLALRYVSAHGPATVKDMAWWSGLTVTECERGLRTSVPTLEEVTVAGRTLWLAPGPARRWRTPVAHLLPNFDEYTVGYADRSDLVDERAREALRERGEVIFSNVVTLEGRVAGRWRRVQGRRGVVIELTMFRALDGDERAAVEEAVAGYARFAGMPVEVRGLT